ncbi:MAG: ABC transporter ATP-binding protein [Betaproteobacteria bacterium]|nr:ABC transporter ATP-binding protein [Betaproteobacteria bacterium]
MSEGSVGITLQACAKHYGDGRRALHPIDLRVEPGETMVFLGPSGCGKTTTLRLIAGLERPDPGGRVLFDGDDVTALPIEARRVGMVFQNYALFPNLDVRGNVSYGLRIRRVARPELQRRVDELLELMRLREFADRPVQQLSGGQRQRVALARALAPRPRVLLLDEPLAALDAQLRETLRVEMSALLRALRVTSIYVTHDQAEAMALGDRIVVMSHGRIEQVGTPRDIYQRPANLEVAGFIGLLNRLRGGLRDGLVHAEGDVDLWFRPEDARLVAEHEAALRGSVQQVLFLGDRTRVGVSVPDGPLLWADVPGRAQVALHGRVGLRVAAHALLNPGE